MKNKKIKYLVFAILLTLITACNQNKPLTLVNGRLLEFSENCTSHDNSGNCTHFIAIIKAGVNDSYNNNATINQNYYNIANYIRDNDISKYDEIQYWAIHNETETKIISFSLSKEVIDKIKSNNIVDNQLGNYVNDLYVNPSLQ